MTFSVGSRYPRNRPNAANSTDPIQTLSPVAIHRSAAMCGLPVILPTAKDGHDRDEPQHHGREQLEGDVGHRGERSQP